MQQPNVITQARYSFTQHEMNVLLFIIRSLQKQINNRGLQYNRDLFGSADYKMYFNLADIDPTETNLKRIKTAIKDLRQRSFEIQDSKQWLEVGFINYGLYNYEHKKWEVQISQMLMPYLLNVAEGYTEFQLNVVLRLNSHAQRLYMMMSQFNDTGFFKINASDLRYKLGLEKSYDQYFNFKNRVLKNSQKQVEELFKVDQCDLYFALVEDKKRKDATDDFDRILKFKVITTDDKARQNQQETMQIITFCLDFLRKAYPGKDTLIQAMYNHLHKSRRLNEFSERMYRIQEDSRQEGVTIESKVRLITHILQMDFGWKSSSSRAL